MWTESVSRALTMVRCERFSSFCAGSARWPHVNFVMMKVNPTDGRHGRDGGEGQQIAAKNAENVSLWSKDGFEPEATELSTFPFLPEGTAVLRGFPAPCPLRFQEGQRAIPGDSSRPRQPCRLRNRPCWKLALIYHWFPQIFTFPQIFLFLVTSLKMHCSC